MRFVPKTTISAYPYVLGLTGSIGMGKSTVGKLLLDLRVPVQEADKAVHALYSVGGRAVDAVAKLFPSAVVEGAVDRKVLASHVLGPDQADNLKALEAAVHPLLEAERHDFLVASKAAGNSIAVLDIPLLYEKQLETIVDAVLVVTAPYEVQKRRVMARSGMTLEKFESIVSKQVLDGEKQKRAHFVINTDRELSSVQADVEQLVSQIQAQLPLT